MQLTVLLTSRYNNDPLDSLFEHNVDIVGAGGGGRYGHIPVLEWVRDVLHGPVRAQDQQTYHYQSEIKYRGIDTVEAFSNRIFRYLSYKMVISGTKVDRN